MVDLSWQVFNQALILLQGDNKFLVFLFSDANSIVYIASTSDAEITETTSHTLKQGSVNETKKLKKYLWLVNRGGPESSYNYTSSLYLM